METDSNIDNIANSLIRSSPCHIEVLASARSIHIAKSYRNIPNITIIINILVTIRFSITDNDAATLGAIESISRQHKIFAVWIDHSAKGDIMGNNADVSVLTWHDKVTGASCSIGKVTK